MISWIWTGLVGISVFCAFLTGKGPELAASVTQGAQQGVTLVISMAGALCLWSGVGRLMEQIGITRGLSRLLMPLLRRVFPSTREDPALGGDISANICANFLGLGNAATPMGIRAAQRLKARCGSDTASDELCRLVVLNTASIQLLPTNVAAIRSALGCGSPFDILPAVWCTSLLSAGLGLAAAWLLGKGFRR